MPSTIIPWGDPKARKKWGSNLTVDAIEKSYFNRKFVGTGENNIIEEKTDLKDDAGDRVSFDLSVQLRQNPTFGDRRLKGNEENLRFYTDEVIIDQMRKSVSAGGRMSRKRTAHDMRKIGRDRLGDYWSAYIDQLFFIYLSGARGINEDYFAPLDFTGIAGNPIQAPDADHIVYGGAATSKAEITAADTMSRDVIERTAAYAKMIAAQNPEAQTLHPVTVDGNSRFILVMSEWQAYALRNKDTNGWVQIQRDAAGAMGKGSPLFTDALGMVGNVVLHSHERPIRFNDYGAAANVTAARALFMGKQAGVVAYGTPRGSRFDWQEEMEDYENEPTIAAGIIMGCKKTRYNGRDFGVIAVDTAAKTSKAG